MDRLHHDLYLALEETSCGRPDRRKLGFRRRTRSAGNLPAAVAVSLVEDGSSSSPPQAPLITQPLSDSDDPQLNAHKTNKSRHYCQIGNFESDSFNENFSPTRPANVRRKRKFKKMPVDYVDGCRTPPIEILDGNELTSLPSTVLLQTQAVSPVMAKKRPLLHNKDRFTYCGKRKWSQRDRGDWCEMRERSFSGGSSFLSKGYDFKLKSVEKKRKESILQPGKISLKPISDDEIGINLSLPGSSSFNFVYKSHYKNGTPILNKVTGYKVTTHLPPMFNPIPGTAKFERHHRKKGNKTHPQGLLRNPLQFDDSNSGMECLGNESSSLSSSDSDGLVTNDSDREGDDELTDWPGIEELKVFNKSLSFKTTKTITNPMPPPKRLKKEKFLLKTGWSSCKNRFKKKKGNVDSGNDEDAMMSDSKTVIDINEDIVSKDNITQPNTSFNTFSDVKKAGVEAGIANETFFHSFQTFQEKSVNEGFKQNPRTDFSLQKTSSSDLNLSEKSPQSDHYYSEHSLSTNINEVREIRAGCRRIRDERPGFLILSAANEQLSRFLQDSCQIELKLPNLNDPDEKEKLECLAKLYSLELKIEMGRPVLKKTSNTTQAIRVEHSHPNFHSDHKRRCYGEEVDSPLSLSDSAASINDIDGEVIFKTDVTPRISDNFSNTLVDKSLLDPGEID